MKTFDHNGPGLPGSLFGLPVTLEEAQLVVLPIPWDVTVSYQDGTSQAPQNILHASRQLDLYHPRINEAWKLKAAMAPIPQNLFVENQITRSLAIKHLQALDADPDPTVLASKINEASENLNVYVKKLSQQHLKAGKIVGLLGGDHSTPLGLLRALGEKFDRFGILQIDAHADLRKAYEGFTYSHGSIMYNALRLSAVARLIQVGVRDYCEEEVNVMQRGMGRIKTFFDQDLKRSLLEGETWKSWCSKIIRELPPLVYISFDIDGLDPKLAPHTGTPVPGGLDVHHISYLLDELRNSEKKIIGFDLCEVGPGEWDANVGARILWELCQYTMATQ